MSGEYGRILTPNPYVSALVLTTAFQNGPGVNLGDVSADKFALTLDWNGTLANRIGVRVEWSRDGVTWFQPIDSVIQTPTVADHLVSVCNPGGLRHLRFAFRETIAQGATLTAVLSGGIGT